MSKLISKLERKLVNMGVALIFGAYSLLSINAHFIPRTTSTTIESITASEYNGKKINIIKTTNGAFRNEDSGLYKKHNSEELQSSAKKLIGQKVKIKNYGYARYLDSADYPIRNILGIEKE